jgi:hypothetical protein
MVLRTDALLTNQIRAHGEVSKLALAGSRWFPALKKPGIKPGFSKVPIQ